MTVYVSLPLSGPAAPDGRDAADGARLSLEQAGGRAGDLEVQARYMDDANPVERWDPVAVGRNARRAAQDSSAAAYIGELDSQPTRASMPITNDAGIVQVSPGGSAIDLTQPAEGYPNSPDRYRPSGEVTFARVVPDDAVQVRAIAEWAGEMKLGVVMGAPAHASAFAALMLSEFDADAGEVGVQVAEALKLGRSSPAFLAGAGPVGPGELRAKGSRYAVSGALDPGRLPAGSFAADFRERFDRRPGPHAAYGFEAMRVALDAIGEADREEAFRGSVVDGVLDSEHPDSVLGSYSITSDGDTTLCAVQRYRLEGTLVPGEAVCPRG